MTQHLREALRDFAERADDPSVPLGAAPAAHDLWRQGRRARRQGIGASIIVAGAVLALVGAVVPRVGEELRPTPIPASYDEAALAVPDHIWAPSSWAPTAGEDAPPGPIALVAMAERRSPWLVSSSEQWYGVSAADQSYHWLELPGHDSSDIALSPDGRRIGYFLAGDPPGPGAQSRTVGYAVFDTMTGESVRHPVSTQRGLAGHGLSWSPDSRRLVVDYGQYMPQVGASSLGVVESWEPSSDTVVRLEVEPGAGVSGLAPEGVTTWASDGGVSVVDTVTGKARRLRVSPGEEPLSGKSGVVPDNIYLNPSATAVAVRGDLPLGPRSATTGLRVGRVRDGGRITDVRLLGERWQLNRVLGWTDDEHVLAEAHPRGGFGIRYVTYDLRSGAVDVAIGHTDPQGRWLQASFAEDLLLRPLTAGEAPAAPWHPWWAPVSVLAAVAALALASAARAARRRRVESPAEESA